MCIVVVVLSLYVYVVNCECERVCVCVCACVCVSVLLLAVYCLLCVHTWQEPLWLSGLHSGSDLPLSGQSRHFQASRPSPVKPTMVPLSEKPATTTVR